MTVKKHLKKNYIDFKRFPDLTYLTNDTISLNYSDKINIFAHQVWYVFLVSFCSRNFLIKYLR